MKLSLFRKNQEAHLLKICEERLKTIQGLEALAEARLAEILTLKARLEDFDAARVNALDRLARTRSQSLELVTNPVPFMLGLPPEKWSSVK